MNRLYIIEGLPCSGKSTTSAFVADILKENNKVCYVDEGSGNHPADYEFHAFLTDDDLSEFSDSVQAEILSVSEKTKRGYIAPLSEFQGELFDKLLKFKIYDFLPFETEKPVMLDKWHEFVENCNKDTVYVFNCVLLQNPMCETMMRFGFSSDKSYGFISQIAEIIKPLNPVVIYLKNDDIRQSVEKASKEREGWLDAVIGYHVNGEYGKSINAKGFDGYIKCLLERQKRELMILSELDIKSVVIDNPQRDFEKAYERIREIL
ncbi:MAG: hypothetical protein E7490_04755 [Ruminococcaceae bacterium]|nr:hypothetical protein [Oscillospiraceae bacterium]